MKLRLMKLRLHGTPAECATAAARLRHTPGLPITDERRPHPDRTGELVRVSLTVHLDPHTYHDQGRRR
jgi:hypothetical protein